MAKNTREKAVWWGTFDFEEDDAGCWRVGPTTLWIHRSSRSWRIIHSSSNDALDDAAFVAAPTSVSRTELLPDDPPDGSTVLRYSFQKSADRQIVITPMLADRAVVVRPETPLYILAGEDLTIFASTPVWMRIEAGSPPRLLTEIPSHRPSDTWFGPDTIEGELCYAVKTAGRLRLDKLPLRLHRAVTPIHVHNRASDALYLERVQIPVQYLSLYRGENNFLWTPPVDLDRESSGDQAAVRLAHRPPTEAGASTLLSKARHEVRSNMIIRTFSSIFSR